MSSASEKKALKEFKLVVPGVQDKVALELLKAHKWNAERAIDAFYQGGGKSGDSKKSTSTTSKGSEAHKTNLNKMFDKYAGEGKHKDKMHDTKLAQFFTEHSVSEEDHICMLGLAWKFKCKNIGEISRTEFVEGFATMGIDSSSEIKSQLSTLKSTLAPSGDAKAFKEFYCWLFSFIKDDDERKVVDAEVATEMLSLVFKDRWAHISKWQDFIKSGAIKVVTYDLWEQLLSFTKEVKDPHLQAVDDSGAWPVAIDDFCAFAQKQHQQQQKPADEKKA